jgi:hypothetical protein
MKNILHYQAYCMLGLIQKNSKQIETLLRTRSQKRLAPSLRKQSHSQVIGNRITSQKIKLASLFIQARRRYADDQARPNITVESRNNLQIYNSVKQYYYFNVEIRINKFAYGSNRFTNPEHPEGSSKF